MSSHTVRVFEDGCAIGFALKYINDFLERVSGIDPASLSPTEHLAWFKECEVAARVLGTIRTLVERSTLWRANHALVLRSLSDMAVQPRLDYQ